MKECISHHFACDCREAAFKELLLEVMLDHANQDFTHRDCGNHPCLWCQKAAFLLNIPLPLHHD